MSFDSFLQQLINGLALGSIYALIALGYTMVYGIIELINFAHGEIYMMGAYIGIISVAGLSLSGITSVPIVLTLVLLIAAVYCAACGYTLEKVAYKRMRKSPRLSVLISALGASIFLQNYVQITQGAKDLALPPIFPTGFIFLGDAAETSVARISYLQITIILTSVLMMTVLTLFIKNSKTGKAMRATSEDKTMAGLLGIKVDNIISATFIIGSILAAVAGILVALYYGLVNFYIGFIAGLKAFTAAVLGGIGSVPGAMLGGFLLGMIESFGAALGSAEYKDVYAFLILVVVLIFRPAGLLGKTTTEKV